MIKKIIIAIFICSIYSCAPTRFVKPLNAKQQAVSLSLGGPLIDYKGLPVPMPFITAAYGYGIDSTLTVFGAANITSALYGNIQVEAGVTKKIFRQKGILPAVSLNPVLNFIYRNKDASRIFPQLDVNAYWDHNKGRNFFYAGISNWFELKNKKAHDETQTNHWVITPLVGETFVRRKWNYTIEAKVLAANITNWSVADYKSPFGKHGALGIYFGITRKF